MADWRPSMSRQGEARRQASRKTPLWEHQQQQQWGQEKEEAEQREHPR